jgi:hypothetical protein
MFLLVLLLFSVSQIFLPTTLFINFMSVLPILFFFSHQLLVCCSWVLLFSYQSLICSSYQLLFSLCSFHLLLFSINSGLSSHLLLFSINSGLSSHLLLFSINSGLSSHLLLFSINSGLSSHLLLFSINSGLFLPSCSLIISGQFLPPSLFFNHLWSVLTT